MGKISWLVFWLAMATLTKAYGQDAFRPRDSVRTDGLRLSAELLWPIYLSSKPEEKLSEIAADYSYNRHIGIVELGVQTKQTKPGDNGLLTSTGGYYKLGYEYNLLRNGDDVLSFGGRLAGATYAYEAKDVRVTSSSWGQESAPSSVSQTGNATWAELTSSIKVRVGWQIYLGVTARVGYRLSGFNFDGISPNIVPGFGDAKNPINYMVGYYIGVKIPTLTRAYNPDPPKKR